MDSVIRRSSITYVKAMEYLPDIMYMESEWKETVI